RRLRAAVPLQKPRELAVRSDAMTTTQPLRAATVVLTAALACAACSSSRNDAQTQAAIAELEAAVAAAKAEVQRLKDIDDLENLAGIYGHYVDKSRHDDVADLFAPNGVVEILGRGVYIGQDRVREYMRNLTPGKVGPQESSLFNHMHLQPIIDVLPDGKTAYARSRLFVMFARNDNAQWGDGIYENVFVKQDGIWKL